MYVTDGLRVIGENTAIPAAVYTHGEGGKSMSVRWAEVIEPKPEDTRTAEEIIAHVREKLKQSASG